MRWSDEVDDNAEIATYLQGVGGSVESTYYMS